MEARRTVCILVSGITDNCYVLRPSWFDGLTMRTTKNGLILSLSKDEARVTHR
jgi:hypothetical protein